MIRIREKELGWGSGEDCETCDYMYAPYNNFCDTCRGSIQTTVVCPKCSMAETFLGATKDKICSGCKEKLPDAEKLSETESGRVKFHIEKELIKNEEAAAI
jgi:predicted amidophosphoribosyltransferase